MKKILALVFVPLILIMLGGFSTLQIFNPVEQAPNENLFNNSGFWQGTQGFNIINGTLDTTKTFDNCNSIKGFVVKFKVSNIKTYNTKKAFLSFKLYSDNYSNPLYPGYVETLHFKDGSTQLIGATVDVGTLVNGQSKTVEIDCSYNDQNVESIDIEVEIANMMAMDYIWLYQPKLEYGSSATHWCPSITDNQPFDYDSLNASYQSQKIGDIPKIISYDYTKSLTTVGSFNLSLNANDVFASEIKENTLLLYDGDWLIAQHVKRENNTLYVEGYDGKGLLKQRITLYDTAQDTGTMGYDVVQGSSELCLKHYVVNNIVNPVDSDRVIPTFTIAENKDRGIANDTYISRFEKLDELAEKICKNANIGYDVIPDVLNNKMIFDVIDITDRTINQRDRNQVCFALEALDGKLVTKLSKLTIETGVTNYINAFYATKSGGSLEADATTILTKRAEDTSYAKGIYRREMQLNVSCESVSDITTFAQQQMPQYMKAESFNLELANPYEYGELFFIGDKVTILYKVFGLDETSKPIITIMQIDTVINGAKVSESNGSYSVALSFGEAKPKPFKAVYTKINEKGV